MDDARRADAVDAQRGLVQRSHRAEAVGLPSSFVQGADVSDRPPLARLIQGGRGGEVRLKLFLCMTLIATRAPHEIRDPYTPMYWSRLLALDHNGGSRRVSVALKWLEDNAFIRREKRSGNLPKIALLDPRTGKPFVRPSKDFVAIPLGLWDRGWIVDLSATELAVLLALLHHRGPHRSARYIPTPTRALYGLSADTWTRATKNLTAHGILTVGRTPQGSEFHFQRMRNTYKLDDTNLSRVASP